MIRILLLSLLVLFTLPAIYGQTTGKLTSSATKKVVPASNHVKAEVLVNKNILDLHAAGLDKEVIVSKIVSSASKFDVSTTALIDLKKSGLDADIIKAMIDKTNGSLTRSGNKGAGNTNTSWGNVAVSLVNHPYYFNATKNNTKALEKVIATTKTKSKGFGYGGTDISYEIPGEKSELRLASNDSIAFLINTGSAAPEFILYKLKSENKTRNAVSMQIKTFGGMKSADNVIACNVTQVSNGLFKITPSKKLIPGEYFFTGKPVASATTLDAYAFGID